MPPPWGPGGRPLHRDVNTEEMWAAEPPGWWPEGHGWPPRHDGRTFFRRLTRVFLTVALLALAGLAFMAFTWHIGTTGILLRMAVVAGLGFLLVGGLIMTAGARKFGGPLAELVDAAARVERGDYTARVAERGWGPPAVRQLITTFNSAIARLEAEEDQRRRLLANTSHELRTPLTVLRGEIEAMLDGVHPADEEHLALALDQTQLMARLIEDLRTLALAEAGTLELHPEPTDLAALVRDVAAAFGAVAGREGVGIEVTAPDDAVVEVDPVRIRQVIDNLVANAVRYAPSGSAVTLEVREAPDGIGVAVVDRGPGIPPDLLPHLFDRFRKSDESRGSGLGLAIAKELVEAHGGAIHVESTVGLGARFEVTLPRDR